MTTEPLPYHPLANLFPLIEGKDFDEFCAGIKADGRLHDKIVLLDGQILDGRNRQRACDAVGMVAHYRTFDPKVEGDPLRFVVSKNLHRRHLNESQRAMLAADLANMEQGTRTDLGKPENLQKVSQAEAAQLINVSTRSVASAAKVRADGTPELALAVKQGVIPVSVAVQAVDLTPDRQREIVARARAGDGAGAKGEIKKASRTRREKDLGAKQRRLPQKRYGVILADPEWRFEPWSRQTGMDRAADNHYPTSATEVIAARPVEKIAADDCLLLLWATAPMLPHALLVMAAWGFDYKTHVVWLKDRVGTGYWFRNQHELLLVGTRGNVPAPAMGTQLRSALAYDVGAHSEKPPFAHEIAEAYFPNLPKIELNARTARDGWDAWGNEAPDQIGEVTDMVPPHDPDTGEIIEHQSQDTPGGSGTARKAPSTVVPETATTVEARPGQQGIDSAPQHQSGDAGIVASSIADAPVDGSAGRSWNAAAAGLSRTESQPDEPIVLVEGSPPSASPANGGGDHVAPPSTAESLATENTTDVGDGGPTAAKAVSPASVDLTIPTFLLRGHPDCVVPG